MIDLKKVDEDLQNAFHLIRTRIFPILLEQKIDFETISLVFFCIGRATFQYNEKDITCDEVFKASERLHELLINEGVLDD
jgi:hypothetical protein